MLALSVPPFPVTVSAVAVTGSETRMKPPGVGTLVGPVNAPSWFTLGLAAGFLFTSSMSFAFHGLFGIYYLTVGLLCAGAAVAFALRRQGTGSA